MTVTITVGNSTREYTSWQLAVNSIPANISSTGSNTPYIVEGYNDSEFYTTTGGILCHLSGITTDTTNTITLTAAPGQSFMDNANTQTNAMQYNASNGVGLRVNAGYSQVMFTEVPNVIISRLQMKLQSLGGAANCLQTDNNNYISNCILEQVNSTGAAVFKPGSLSSVVNTLIVARSSGTRGITAAYDTMTVANCTVVSPSDIANTTYGIAGLSETWKIVNTAVFGFGTNFYTGSGTYSHCLNNCSDQAISFGSGNQASKTYSSQFVGTTNATSDFRLKSGANCVDNGTADSTDVPGPSGTTNITGAVDIVGTSRPQGSAWDIGAWELVEGSGAAFAATPTATTSISASLTTAITLAAVAHI